MDKVRQTSLRELNKYWKKVAGEDKADIQLSLFKDKSRLSAMVDAFEISVKRGKGSICASNERSVLTGVYEFFKKLGVKFLHPGDAGEIIVKKEARDCSVEFSHTASYIHRCITIEGSVSRENALEMIDWLPKAGFNSYFIQFQSGDIFFRKWYEHWWNPLISAPKHKREDSDRYAAEVIDAIRERGLVHHAVGHGWTCEPLGMHVDDWDVYPDSSISDESRAKLALVNGERKFFKGVPMTTNLCYSDPGARKLMVDSIAGYLETHKVDYLHVWLADDCNNFCTCENCKNVLPSDHYVMLLNELDEKLTEAGNLTAKIVFLMYNELMLPPKTQKIKNPGRFVLMFAPSARNYCRNLSEFSDDSDALDAKTYSRANNFMPVSDMNLALSYLKAWRKNFSGDSFIFEYPYIWANCKEIGGVILAKTISRDVKELKRFGLNGYLSCQMQRAFFPTGLSMYVLGNTLFDSSLTYEQLETDYYDAAFISFAKEIKEIMDRTQGWMADDYLNHRICEKGEEIVGRALSELKNCRKSTAQIEELIKKADAKVAVRLDAVRHLHLYYQKLLLLFIEKAGRADEEMLAAMLDDIAVFLFSAEPRFQTIMDVGQYFLHIKIFVGEHW